MHNESQADREIVEPVKQSKMQRIKANAAVAAWIGIPVALTGVAMYASVKLTMTQLETARLNLEAARLNKS